ncbi:hypothetical protein LHP98_18945 [Rhodobacter sp. Har01]|uniref:hypothetical protein n=1 Tax=Rhodobacter sp. Har01 TaxID=2883999 RepID=UPI001D0728C3|nr:hypothetical protein [Rhodobacter sp. Har01]MCB6180195.1 hypothetical protein [Rhodobacter sp. Har01]
MAAWAIINALPLVMLVATALAVVILRLSHGSTEARINLGREVHSRFEKAIGDCLVVRRAVSSLEEDPDRAIEGKYGSRARPQSDRLGQIRSLRVEADSVMRALAALPREIGEMRVSQLKAYVRTISKLQGHLQDLQRAVAQMDQRPSRGPSLRIVGAEQIASC